MTCKHLFKAVALALSLAVGAAPALAKNFTELKAAASPAGGAWYVGMGAMGKAISTMYPELDVSLFPRYGFNDVCRAATLRLLPLPAEREHGGHHDEEHRATCPEWYNKPIRRKNESGVITSRYPWHYLYTVVDHLAEGLESNIPAIVELGTGIYMEIA